MRLRRLTPTDARWCRGVAVFSGAATAMLTNGNPAISVGCLAGYGLVSAALHAVTRVA